MSISFAPRRPSHRRAVALAVVLIGLLSGCATGQRPTLTTEPIIDNTVAAVDDLLDRPAEQFTATYTVQPSTALANGVEAVVVKSGQKVRVTIGDVDYLSGDQTLTCLDQLTDCFDGVLDNYISNLNVTSGFWNAAIKARLRVDARRNIGAIEEYDTEIAAASATCVDVKLDGGTSSYCAHPSGVVARYNGADAHIELVEFSDSVDQSPLAPTLG